MKFERLDTLIEDLESYCGDWWYQCKRNSDEQVRDGLKDDIWWAKQAVGSLKEAKAHLQKVKD